MSRTANRDDYGGGHSPPRDGPPLNDLRRGDYFPRDVYDHPEHYTHGGGNSYDRETIAMVKAMRGKPDSTLVTIYRALPPGHTTIHTGDWVAVSLAYARQHAMQRGWDEWVEGEGWVRHEDDWPVISARVPVSTVRNGGNDIIEWGYFGSDIHARVVQGSLPKTSDSRACAQDAAGKQATLVRSTVRSMTIRQVIAREEVHHDFSPEVMQQIRRQRAEQGEGDNRPILEILEGMGMSASDLAELKAHRASD